MRRAKKLIETMRYSIKQARETLGQVGITTQQYLRNRLWGYYGKANSLYVTACFDSDTASVELLELFTELHKLRSDIRATLS